MNTDLERRVEELEEWRDKVDAKLDDIRDGISEINVQLAKRRECPSPGLCNDLTPRIATLESKMSILHDWHQQAIGVQQSAKAIWAVIGGLFASAVAWLVAKLTGNQP